MPPFSTDPAVWFLAKDEIGDRGLQVYSSQNKVTVFVEAKNYMSRLFELLGGTTAGDYIHIVDWQLDLDACLLGKSNLTSDVRTVLSNAYKNKADIFLLLSLHFGADNESVRTSLRKIGITCVTDSRNAFCGSAHQKFVVVFKQDSQTLHAFCGGIDLAKDRWDDVGHDVNTYSQRQITADPYNGGWHDVHCEILGSAAVDLENAFRERWNDPNPPSKLCKTPSPIKQPIPAQNANGPHHVQILRTYPCRLNDEKATLPFAPRGEFTSRSALIKAISLARELIYIEDQYFISYEVAAAIKLSLALYPALRVIVLVPARPDLLIARLFMNTHQGLILDDLYKAAEGRFAIYNLLNPVLQNASIYVHAKVAIVDDVWAEIGSMNLNRRSMSNDKEIALAVVDSQLTTDGRCQFARNLRHLLWAEHLDLQEPIEDDPKKGFDLWVTRSALPSVRAKRHPTPFELPLDATQQLVYDIAYSTAIDPQSLCSGSPRIPP